MSKDGVAGDIPSQGNSGLVARVTRSYSHGSALRAAVFIFALLVTLIPLSTEDLQGRTPIRDVDQYLMTHGLYALTLGELKQIVKLKGLEAYWVGPVANAKYVLDASENDRISIRYLPKGHGLEDLGSNYRVVSTYKTNNSFHLFREAAKEPDSISFTNVNGNQILYYKDLPQNVYTAFKGKDVQVELFDSRTGTALELAINDRLTLII
ncbi:MAG: hypothetical protein H7227_08175 [Actinobacteria bacterium]|nr:hypothetical protein [Actinomycetota bacterium]